MLLLSCKRETDDEEEEEPPAKIQRVKAARVKTKDIQSFFTAKPKPKDTPENKVIKPQTRAPPILFKTFGLKGSDALI